MSSIFMRLQTVKPRKGILDRRYQEVAGIKCVCFEPEAAGEEGRVVSQLQESLCCQGQQAFRTGRKLLEAVRGCKDRTECDIPVGYLNVLQSRRCADTQNSALGSRSSEALGLKPLKLGLKSHFMELCKSKQAIDQLFSQEKGWNLSYWKKAVLNLKEVKPHPTTAVLWFPQKHCMEKLDKATSLSTKQDFDSSLRASQVALAWVEDQGERTALKQAWLQRKESESDKAITRVGLTSTREIVPLKAKTKQKRKSLKLGMSLFINSSITSIGLHGTIAGQGS